MKFVELVPASAYSDAIEALSSSEKLVVCGSFEDRQYIEDSLALAVEPADVILARALKIDVEAWLNARRVEVEAGAVDDGVALTDLSGAWPSETVEQAGFSLAHDMMTGQLHTRLVGARVKADEAWQIPAHFHFGGWNECPAPDVQCAIWRYWQAQYGAHIVAVSNDVIEAYVERPPKTEAEAMALAWQQYYYCADIVDQGVETVTSLAASLLGNSVWFFWWD
ncbi:DUF4253 domain-containing protein [Simiduia curdlanivorans]|uniref:DUF4253 domain-containing protein n=1 Tax=Simiduia curdlanivorans TaxID=1492769 RepID=A0ABV8VAE6_9GAMM|nr:DUF4253 domain-containing protein [Simiduia curdlanivorans]MDN3639643.1 DUF4253 domain-containing protein [Simiduia curdlanivorans]